MNQSGGSTGSVAAANHSTAFLLRTNRSLCGPVGLRPLPSDYQPAAEMLPGAAAEPSEQEVTSESLDDAYEPAEQLGAELLTLSLLPESRWKTLLNLDLIKVSPALHATVQSGFRAPAVYLLTDTSEPDRCAGNTDSNN